MQIEDHFRGGVSECRRAISLARASRARVGESLHLLRETAAKFWHLPDILLTLAGQLRAPGGRSADNASHFKRL